MRYLDSYISNHQWSMVPIAIEERYPIENPRYVGEQIGKSGDDEYIDLFVHTYPEYGEYVVYGIASTDRVDLLHKYIHLTTDYTKVASIAAQYGQVRNLQYILYNFGHLINIQKVAVYAATGRQYHILTDLFRRYRIDYNRVALAGVTIGDIRILDMAIQRGANNYNQIMEIILRRRFNHPDIVRYLNRVMRSS